MKITSIDISSRAAAPTPITIDVYITPNTYVGNDTSGATWIQVSTGTGASKGATAGTPTEINVADFVLPPGKHGMYVVVRNGGIHYTRGTSTNTKYSNADLGLTLGISKSALFNSSRFSPRIWNGALCYVSGDKAGTGQYGFGCMGTNAKVPQLKLSADPVLGASVKVDITDMVANKPGLVYLWFGLKQIRFDLSSISLPGCFLLNDGTVAILALRNTNGTLSLPATVPNNASLAGVLVYGQSFNAAA